jgi:citrate lyase subunit beta/citryl-CoA lyase
MSPAERDTVMPIRHTRSQLFVPGNRPGWFEKAVASGADCVVIDLEDSVPPDSKADARDLTVRILSDLHAESGPVVTVRVNGPSTEWFLDDVCASVEAGADCVAIPKVAGAEEVIGADCLVTAAELRCGRQPGTTHIHPLLETPSAIRRAYDVATASPRVAYLGGISAAGGDIESGIGYQWTPAGTETLVYRSTVLLDARAAGVPCPVTGIWTDLENLDGLRRFAQASREIGYDGMMVVHPSQVEIVNDVFLPSPEDLDRDRRLIEAVNEAQAAGSASIRFDGHMVDIAMAKRAKHRLDRFADDPDKPSDRGHQA